MSFGIADPDHNQPGFSQEPGCGFSSLLRKWGTVAGPRGFAPPNQLRPTETLSGPRPSHTNASLVTGGRTSKTQAPVETRSRQLGRKPGGSLLKGAACTFHTSQLGGQLSLLEPRLWGLPRSFAGSLAIARNLLSSSDSLTGHPEHDRCHFLSP